MAAGGAVAATAALLVVLLAAAAVSGLPAINVTAMAFEEGYSPLFGHHNILRSADGRTISLLLDRSTGKPWRVQTNLYGNGSVGRGREERYVLPFDPTTEFHRYSILWTSASVAFYVDDVPVREVRRCPAMAGDFPSKPMSLYATVWDASTWATSGGRYRVNYRYGPFVASFTDLALLGCRVVGAGDGDDDEHNIRMVAGGVGRRCGDGAEEEKLRASEVAVMTVEKQQAMRRFREQNMVYSYCYDTRRYPAALPECDVVESERRRFKDSGQLRFALRRRAPRRGSSSSSRAAAAAGRARSAAAAAASSRAAAAAAKKQQAAAEMVLVARE
nr:unnamed protein product [Digitaria exilis]